MREQHQDGPIFPTGYPAVARRCACVFQRWELRKTCRCGPRLDARRQCNPIFFVQRLGRIGHLANFQNVARSRWIPGNSLYRGPCEPMVASMGRIGTTTRNYGARFQSDRRQSANDRLFDHGALAILGSNNNYRNRYSVAREKGARRTHRLLSTLLAPLHSDPEELAHRMLRRFGSIAEIGNASPDELRGCSLDGETWSESFIAVRDLLSEGHREAFTRVPLDSADAALHRYLRASIGSSKHEIMVAIFADEAGYVISEEIVGEGDQGSLQLSLRRIFGKALKVEARRILLAHNHPSGNSEPSQADVEQTKALIDQSHRLGINFEDHLIVGRAHVTSMRARGLL